MPLKTLHKVIDAEIEEWVMKLNEIRDLIEKGQSGIVGSLESHGYISVESDEGLKLIDQALVKLDAFIADDNIIG